MEDTSPLTKTKNWIKSAVIGIGLCPFASKVFIDKQIKYVEHTQISWQDFTCSVESIINQLLDPITIYSTGIIIISEGLEDFNTYLEVVYNLEEWLLIEGYNIDIQLASFHPDYQFANSAKDDVSNFTNRSPFPLIHLLKTKDVEDAIVSHPNTLEIPEANIKKLKEMGIKKVVEIWRSILR